MNMVAWHVYADGAWGVAQEEEGRRPVNVWVTPERMARAELRHRADDCFDRCTPVWGDVVAETVGFTREGYVTAEAADGFVALYEADAYHRDRYEVRRSWDRVSYTVAIACRGRLRPFVSYMLPLV